MSVSGGEGFAGNEEDLREFRLLADSPIRSPERTPALQRWRSYKHDRLRERFRTGDQPLYKGWSMLALQDHLIDLSGAQLDGICVGYVDLRGVKLDGASLRGASLKGAEFEHASLRGVDLSGGRLIDADLGQADLSGANLADVDLSGASLVGAKLEGADLARCRVYGTAAWDIEGTPSNQHDLVITPAFEAEVTVDDIKVAQFIYLLLGNPTIRDVIDTITSKVVLILGRFTSERKAVLDSLRNRLREHNLSPVVFDFAIPSRRDMTDTVRVLAGMARFVIADLSDPSTVPYELGGFVDRTLVPVRPIIVEGQQPPHGFSDLRTRYHWLLAPYSYQTLDGLLANLETQVIAPAEAKREELKGGTG